MSNPNATPPPANRPLERNYKANHCLFSPDLLPDFLGRWHWRYLSNPMIKAHRIHVWYIYPHSGDVYGRYREIYHTWVLWVYDKDNSKFKPCSYNRYTDAPSRVTILTLRKLSLNFKPYKVGQQPSPVGRRSATARVKAREAERRTSNVSLAGGSSEDDGHGWDANHYTAM